MLVSALKSYSCCSSTNAMRSGYDSPLQSDNLTLKEFDDKRFSTYLSAVVSVSVKWKCFFKIKTYL